MKINKGNGISCFQLCAVISSIQNVMAEENGSLIAFWVEGFKGFDKKIRVCGVWKAVYVVVWLFYFCFVELLTLPFSCTFVSRTE